MDKFGREIKIASLTWNLVTRQFKYAEFNGGEETHSSQFKMKFGAWPNSNLQNSMVIFISSVLDREYPFWAYLLQKLSKFSVEAEIRSVPTLIQICRIQ